MRYYLDFEKKLEPLERRMLEIERFYGFNDPRFSKEIAGLTKKISKLEKEIYGELTNWQRLQISRHLDRPHTLDYVNNLFTDFTEFHGDRKFKDDPAIIAGFAAFEGIGIAVLGHQKGQNVREMAFRNFGMAHPDGYRKAMRIMEMANRWNKPIITFIDTPGAFPGIGAEERGQAEAIASSIEFMFSLSVPIISIVIGEGGSGGALAIGVGNRILMMENATYSVISPEGCAAILWRDGSKGPLAADALKPTSYELHKLKVVDAVIKEPFGGAHRNWKQTFLNLKEPFSKYLKELMNFSSDVLINQRYQKFRNMGVFESKN
ncbi:MAG TPA: acetyl-CoA carboxylase carboxyltransferase subunit alpha [Syntrophorhabdaceae bacterium]|jgi:acetyl-CoA carboxylase carboxyl transferase subunit alpha|nr:acetyl-CoA carboxylase carboxyltransferase subunit alpha [Syntrophorhabdaceae bacterium]MDI9560137.1 acetyl-CoA carboxylase carboxyltransferase subunit alpha [Pseudomonadota bacterium]HNZ58762.1 acetyl-CoA carboxylase carboxyltransferase subunit alpha [Syntrophorhabdaceae bacterium]HOG39501.1 acetyl-CoA carboxylase carboxyltransferase subunit alpha [Syntrophorhabdaceae bacterium]HQG51084.1 acetyl-CoA carboxylase carboxyltransferase subunit alpha [Syntrophorhabdaceae bacterium]